MTEGMVFEWHEAKRLATLDKHGIDFAYAIEIFAEKVLIAPSALVGREKRWLAVGMFAEREIAIVFTYRGAAVRIITARRARENERRWYHESNAATGESA